VPVLLKGLSVPSAFSEVGRLRLADVFLGEEELPFLLLKDDDSLRLGI
jgi:hypothetical protein